MTFERGFVLARSEARLKTRIWDDPDFLALPGPQQLTYLFLISQPDISHCGVLSLRLRRWSRKLSYTVEQLDKSLAGLEAARFVVVDHDEEELLVRSALRNDGVTVNWKILIAASRELESVNSVPVRRTLADEIQRALTDGLVRERTVPVLQEMLETLGQSQPVSPPPQQQAIPGIQIDQHTADDHAATTRKPPQTRPNPDPKPERRRGTRIPDDFIATEAMLEWARTKCTHLTGSDIEYETEQFIGYWQAKTGQGATKLDWKRTWENWVRKANKDAERLAKRRDGPARTITPDDARCPRHPRQPASNCLTCDSEARGVP